MNNVIVKTESLSKSFGTITALNNVSFTIEEGETVGLVGPNGAGKTTLMKMLCGALHPTSGKCTLLGRSPDRLDHPGSRLGFALDPPGVPGTMSVSEWLTLECRAQHLPSRSVTTILEDFDLEKLASHRFGKLSLGQRQRVALAAACVGNPAFLILDEPTNGLDVQAVQWLRAMVKQRGANGQTTLISSHNLAELGKETSRIIVLRTGVRFDGFGLLDDYDHAEERYLELIGADEQEGERS